MMTNYANTNTPSVAHPSMGPFPTLGYVPDLSHESSHSVATPSYVPLTPTSNVHGPSYQGPAYGGTHQGYLLRSTTNPYYPYLGPPLVALVQAPP